MPMTPEQVTTIRAYVVAHPEIFKTPRFPRDENGYFDGSATNALRDYFNEDSSFVVWRTNATVRSIVENGFTWTAIDSLTVGKARIWDWMTRSYGGMGGEPTINPSKTNVRQGLQDCFGSTQPNITPHLKRPATKGEAVFATGDGTTASPGLLVF